MTGIDACDLCGSHRLIFAYAPPTSGRGLAVYVCQQCGLAQSLPRIDHVDSRRVSISSGADWGNIRYGKGFRTESALELLATVLDLAKVQGCLDVGSSRGSFVRRLREVAPQAEIVALEPDRSVVQDYAAIPGIHLVADRLEHARLPKARFDLIYCCHTLEHLRSPKQALRMLRRAMTDDGVLFVEVPNLDFIARADLVEEWFIDKHLYHFCRETLEGCLREAGFVQRAGVSAPEAENVTLVAAKGESDHHGGSMTARTPPQATLDRIVRYQTTVRDNQAAMRRASRQIEALLSRRVAVWGAGRLFDSLIQYGHLDVKRLVAVVDQHLGEHVGTVHAVRVEPPRVLREIRPDVVIVASRAYAEEIEGQIRRLLGNIPEVVRIEDLLREGLPA